MHITRTLARQQRMKLERWRQTTLVSNFAQEMLRETQDLKTNNMQLITSLNAQAKIPVVYIKRFSH